jgi:hypothetical protein
MIDERTSIDWVPALAEQLDWHWRSFVRPKLDGLTDDELHWEPVPGGWGVRPRGTSTAPTQGGSGEWTADFGPPRDPAPVTTIAWRLGHITAGCFGARAASHFDGPPVDYLSHDYPATADATLARLDESYGRWMGGVQSLQPEDLERQVGPAEEGWEEHPMAELVLHISREAIHHGAECLLLRDLYRSGAAAGR